MVLFLITEVIVTLLAIKKQRLSMMVRFISASVFFHKYDRTIDQMVQGARSGKQNIVESSIASVISKETEIKLTNVARASLEELLIDYEDFMRTQKSKNGTETIVFPSGLMN